MILLIDNYDSFVYNLYQLLGGIRPDIEVIRNDACTIADIEAMAPEAIVLSPGPGRPIDAGICLEVIRHFSGTIPIFGVCLGMQSICEAFGGIVTYAKELMHGKTSLILAEPDSVLFAGMEEPFPAARYHSLSASDEGLPKELRVTARTGDGEIMALEHRTAPVFGVQFHPESIMTPNGETIMKNFLNSLSGQPIRCER